MKKVSLVVAMVLMVALALAGCAGGGNGGAAEGPISGEYKLTSAIAGGQEMSVDELKSVLGESTAAALDMTFNFSGNKVKVTAMGQTEEVDYKLDGETFSVTQGGTTLNGTFKDDKLTIDAGGATLIFTK